jgi:hypothetical protein
MSTLKTVALLALLAASALLGACESASPTEPENVQAPDVLCETGPYLIHLSGQCRVASSHRIVCEDETTTTPREKVLNVVFQLRNADTGTPVETKSINPAALPREVSFSGLAAANYEVRHTIQAKDCSATFTTYADLDVF